MLLHADNFAIYGANQALMRNGIYAENPGCGLVADPDGLSPGRVLEPGWDGLNNSNTNWRYAFQVGQQDTVGVALRIWQTNLPAGSFKAFFLQIRSSENKIMASVSVDATGALTVRTYNKNTGDPVNAYATPVPVISAEGWYHVEFKYTHAVLDLCSFELRVEGQTVLKQTDVADGGWKTLVVANPPTYAPDRAAQAAALWNGFTDPAQYFIKDLVIWDGEGTFNNNFLGSVLVTNLVPNSDVALNWGLTGGATGFGILDNIPPNDTQFIYAPNIPPPAGPYVGTLTDLPVNTTSVRGVITYVRAAKSDGGDGSLQVGMISGASTTLGSDRPITVAQTYWRDVFETDPATGALWIPAAVNAAKIQINRTT